jgi:quinol monooxygenase YgiN
MMLIAILDLDVAAVRRGAALDQFIAEAPTVRKMQGNIAYRPYADPVVDTRVTLVHEWEARPDFDAYLASTCFARLRDVLGPMMIGVPVSRRFEASLIETVR